MILIELLVLAFLIYIISLLGYSLLRGAPYAAIGQSRIKIMFMLLNAKKGKLVDVGSGDGRIVIYADKHGLDAYGIEINPLLVFLSRRKIKKLKLRNSKIILKDYWKHNFSGYDYVTVWGTKHMMKGLEKKLRRELKTGAKVVCNHFPFPKWKATKMSNDVYLYIQK